MQQYIQHLVLKLKKLVLFFQNELSMSLIEESEEDYSLETLNLEEDLNCVNGDKV